LPVIIILSVIVIVLILSVICLSYVLYVRIRRHVGNQKPETNAHEETELIETQALHS
jgi:predicted Holliday junction resolvase-like endonuclease